MAFKVIRGQYSPVDLRFILPQILLAVVSVAIGYPAKLSKSTESSILDFLNINISQQILLQVTGAASSSRVNFNVYPT